MTDKSAFAGRLVALMHERGLSKSDVARLMYGSYTDANGHNVAKHRDRLTAWTLGRQMPKAQQLAALATALRVPVHALVPPPPPPARISCGCRPVPGRTDIMEVWVEGRATAAEIRIILNAFETLQAGALPAP